MKTKQGERKGRKIGGRNIKWKGRIMRGKHKERRRGRKEKSRESQIRI